MSRWWYKPGRFTCGEHVDAWKKNQGWDAQAEAREAAAAVTPEVIDIALRILEALEAHGRRFTGYRQSEMASRVGSRPQFGTITGTELLYAAGIRSTTKAQRDEAVAYLKAQRLIEVSTGAVSGNAIRRRTHAEGTRGNATEKAGRGALDTEATGPGGKGRPATMYRLTRPCGNIEEAKVDLIGEMLIQRFQPGSRVGLFEVRFALPLMYRANVKVTRALMWQMCLWGDCRTDPLDAGPNADAWVFV